MQEENQDEVWNSRNTFPSCDLLFRKRWKDTMFLNIYEATEAGKIAFGSSFPGEIKKYDIAPGQEIVVQKSSVLVCEESVERSVFFNKKVSTWLFGGECFVMSSL